MISIFTPSHDPKFLNQAYDSLVAQTDQDWQWIVVLNGPENWKPPVKDDRVITYRAESNRGVGFYKAEAVNWCTSDLCLELDHDDCLDPEAVRLVRKAFEENPNASFVYSDFSYVNEDLTPRHDKYSPEYGWSYRNEGAFTVANAMANHPHNVAHIWYAPNHLRAFRKSAYSKAGGYDRSMHVLDDQDIMYKLYMQGGFVHIPECLYYQRVHASNTQAREDINPFIQEETIRMHDRTIQPMILKWANDNGLLALDMGAAHNPAPGYKTVDMHEPADYLGDVFDVLANMEDNSVGVIRAVDFLEHIPDKVRIWNEMYRVLAHGGMILSLTPSTDGRGAYQDPTHNAFYNQNSFWYFADENYRKFVPELKMNFQISRLITYFPSDWHREHNIPYVCANLVALKSEERFGGRLGI